MLMRSLQQGVTERKWGITQAIPRRALFNICITLQRIPTFRQRHPLARDGLKDLYLRLVRGIASLQVNNSVCFAFQIRDTDLRI